MLMMSNRFYVFFSSMAMLLLLISCGDNVKVKNSKESNSVCSSSDCDLIYNWKLTLHGKSFPDKTKIIINNQIVLNECFNKQKYSINRGSYPETLYLEHFIAPKRGELSVKVYDLGVDCSEENEFLSNQDVPFEELKTSQGHEILINL